MTDLRARCAELEAHRKELGDALLRFTPGGSEFFLQDGDGFKVDAKACEAIIREKMDALHEARCRVVQQGREIIALQAKVDALTAEPTDYEVGQFERDWTAYPGEGLTAAFNAALTAFLRRRTGHD